VAIKAVAHKLARACYHIMREGVPYDGTRALCHEQELTIMGWVAAPPRVGKTMVLIARHRIPPVCSDVCARAASHEGWIARSEATILCDSCYAIDGYGHGEELRFSGPVFPARGRCNELRAYSGHEGPSFRLMPGGFRLMPGRL